MELKRIILGLTVFTFTLLSTNGDAPLSDENLVLSAQPVTDMNIDTFRHQLLRGEMAENSELAEKWIEPPLNLNKYIYLFNVTNPDDIVEGNKPILSEIGPYAFRVRFKKVNLNFNEDEGTVSYDSFKWYEFLPEESIGSLNDHVIALNVPFVNLAIKTEGVLPLMQQMVLTNIIKLMKVSPFVAKPVEELLFKGYKDQFMVMIGQARGKEVLPNGTFGFFYGQNHTSDGSYSVHTGVKDSSKFLKITEYNNMTQLPYYNGEKCNKIEGSIDTHGLLFGVNNTKEDTLHMYTPELCRTLPLKFEKEVEYAGRGTFRFSPSESALAAIDVEPDNECFCQTQDHCLKSGVFSTEPCNPNSPRIWSYPHFYLADDSYYDAVEGLSRDKALHQTYFDLDPVYGFARGSHKRLQMNIGVKAMAHIQAFNQFPELVFPLLWFDEAYTTQL